MRILRALAVALIGLQVACSPSAEVGEGGDPVSAAPESLSEVASAPAPAAEITGGEETQPSLFAELQQPYASAEYERGRRLFLQCRSCHSVDEGDPNLAGPNLYGVFGRRAGSLEGFSYSTALQDADFDWTTGHLDNWLQDPKGFLPGNKMTFSRIADEADRNAIIAYLMTESGYVP